MNPGILSLGAAYLDINASKFPISRLREREHTEIVGSEYQVVPGGSALNFAQICASLDLKPVFVGKIGDDRFGEFLVESVKAKGIVPAFIKSSQVSTNISVNLTDPDGQSIYEVAGTANRSLTPEEVKEKIGEFLDQIKYLYLGGIFKLRNLSPALADLATDAKSRDIRVILDHGRITNEVGEDGKQIIKNLIGQVDYYLPSRDEFLTAWDTKSLEEGFGKVRKLSKCVIVVKDAQNGAIGLENQQIVTVPAFDVNVVNPVGAGDSFNAGFIKATIEGQSFLDAIRFGHAVAGVKISGLDVNKENLAQLLESNPPSRLISHY